MLLADEFIEGPRPHPFREGLSSRGFALAGAIKQIHLLNF